MEGLRAVQDSDEWSASLGSLDPDLAERLWRLSEKMTGVKFSG